MKCQHEGCSSTAKVYAPPSPEAPARAVCFIHAVLHHRSFWHELCDQSHPIPASAYCPELRTPPPGSPTCSVADCPALAVPAHWKRAAPGLVAHVCDEHAGIAATFTGLTLTWPVDFDPDRLTRHGPGDILTTIDRSEAMT